MGYTFGPPQGLLLPATVPDAHTWNAAQTFNGQTTFSNNVIFSADNTYDLGASGATRPRDAYVANSVVVASSITISSGTVASTGTLTLRASATSSTAITSTGCHSATNGSFDLGTASLRWRDIHLSRWIQQSETTSNPTTSDLSADAEVAIYTKADTLVFAYNNGGTMTYITIPLDGSTATWTHGTTAP